MTITLNKELDARGITLRSNGYVEFTIMPHNGGMLRWALHDRAGNVIGHFKTLHGAEYRALSDYAEKLSAD